MAVTVFSEKDLKEGRALLEEGKVEAILFSEGTYQVEVKDGKDHFWPFLQLGDEGQLKDHFCTCSKAEQGGGCSHQSAAWLKIFNDKNTPLHVRFRSSLWNQLCQIAGRRHGYDVSVLKKIAGGGFAAHSVKGKVLFSIHSLTQKGKDRLKEIITQRSVETEETSLKFSNLSPDELKLWKEGHPSHQLQYELSFWSDLAKWWMLLQEDKKKYTITFSEANEILPKTIEIKFGECEFSFYIADVNWAHIIPALATVQSPLRVFELTHQEIEKIFYDPLKKSFLIDIKTVKENEKDFTETKVKTYPVGEWMFIKGKGFYPAKLDVLLNKKTISQDQIEKFLQKHADLVQEHLVGCHISLEPLSAKYHLFFDRTSSLHIVCYVFQVGDLQKIGSFCFGSWVYVADKGFYHLHHLLFQDVEKIIPKEEVSAFVNRHRHWLSGCSGFETHVSGVESNLTYVVIPDKGVRFESKLDVTEDSQEMIDLEDWVYVKGSGFYSKGIKRSGQNVKAGLFVPMEELVKFIHAYQEELDPITHFLSTTSPLEKSGLRISLNEQEQIVINPDYVFKEVYRNKDVQVYDGLTFVENEGFCEIPSEFKMPDPYFKKTIIDSGAEPYFIFYEIDQLRPFILSCDPRLEKPKHLVLDISQIKKEGDGNWIVELSYESELGTVGGLEIWKALHAGKRYLFSQAGCILLKEPRFNWIKGLAKKRWLKQGKQIALTSLEWMRLFIFEEIAPPKDPESLKIFEEFKSCQTDEILSIEGLQSHLRPYQETGLKWLWFLYCQGLSGLLCDEMGLGKTHQAMALLQAVKNKNSGGKFLVVCPTSVIYHWQELLKKFLPTLRVCVFYGAQRTLSKFETDFDVLLTSYGTLRSEKNPLSEIIFEIAVFDETQVAKNAHSQTHKALKLIQARTRVGLTGTPIENRLLELKSLFDVVIPGYMPTEGLFKEMFINPIEKQQDQEKKTLLTRFIHPFILRRRKSEVLLELPEKTEEIAYASLSEEQKELYRKAYLSLRAPLLKDLQDDHKSVPYMHVFSLLSKLKQICDHPALALGDTDNYKQHASGKWDFFIELLAEARDSGQKLVVFSQYLGMLDIIQKYLEEEKIGYATIRGSTRDRQSQIEKFRDDPSCEVFIGSLQAAGVGIDLIAASVVIHYDRWWNPAKENQATDRVHRIGQNRGVQVFKMVTKGTIEEHIQNLIEKKSSLMQEIIGYDDQDQIKHLDREELIQLIRLMEIDLKQN